MTRIHVSADEAGDFSFNKGPGASRYFILTTVVLTDPDCSVGNELLALRRQIAWEGAELGDHFHATEDKQAVRDRVFTLLGHHGFRVDCTIFDKPKTEPHLASVDAGFYQFSWQYHFKYITGQVAAPGDELFIIAASLGTKKKRGTFHQALKSGVNVTRTAMQTAFWPAAIDPCLQVADYCSWAIQRKWERGDSRSYDLIKDKLASEFDVFRNSQTTYY